MIEPLHVRIRKCTTVPEALGMLASAIDDIYERIEALQARPQAISVLSWDEPETTGLNWGAAPTTLLPEQTNRPVAPAELKPPGQQSDATAQQRKIAKLREKIAETADPGDLRALEATLRLALEEHVRLPSPDVAPDVGEEVIGEGWSSLAKKATPEQIVERMQWAKRVGLEQYMRTAEALKMAAEAGGNDVEELYAWFGHVGPRGLFTADHVACLQLSYDDRLWLVEKMAEEDEVLGKDMGADLLKSEDSIDRDAARELYEPTWKS